MTKNFQSTQSGTPLGFSGTILTLAAVFFVLDLSLPLGIAGGIPYVAVVLVALWSPHKKHTLLTASGVTLLTILGFFFSPAGSTLWIVLVNRALAIFAIWTVAIVSLKRYSTGLNLLRSDERLQRLLDSTKEAIYGLDLTGNCTFANPACCRLLGYDDVKQLLGRNMHGLIHHTHPDGSPYPEKECHIFEAFRNGTNTHVDDEVLWRADGTSFPAEYWSHPIHKDGEIIGSVVTFIDITERRQSEKLLRFIQVAVENSSVAAYWMTPEAEFVYVNEAASRMLGYSREELLTMFVFDIDPDFPPERWAEHWPKIEKEHHFTIEAHHRRKDGSIFPVQITANYLEFEGKKYNCSLVQDITERKQAEEALQQSEARFRGVFEHAPLAIGLVGLDGNMLDVNPKFSEMLGYTQEEFRRMNIADFSHPEDIQSDMDLFAELQEGGRDYYQLEKRHIQKNGEVIWVNLRVSLIKDSEGKPQFAIGMVHDITERKRTEKELRKSRERLEMAIWSTDLGVWDHDLQNNTFVIDEGIAKALGYTKDELKLDVSNVEKLIHPDDLPKQQETLARTLTGETEFYEMEQRMRTKSGDWIWVRDRGKVVERDSEGNPLRMTGTQQDITARKKAEETLRKSEASLARAQQVAHIGNWSYDIINDKVHWSDENYRIYGVDPETFEASYEAFVALHHPEDRDRVDQLTRKSMQTGEPLDFEHRVIRPDGSLRHLHSLGEMTKDASGKVVRMFGTVQDITERKQAEEAVTRSEKQFRTLIENAPDGLLLADKEGQIILANPRTEEMFGYTQEELLGQPVEKLIPERFLKHHVAKRESFVANPSPQFMAADQNLYALRKDGSEFPIEINLGPIESKTGLMISVTISDITKRKQAEEALQTSEALLKEAQRVSSMGSWEWNITTGDLKWSDEIYRLFGQTPQSFGATYDAFVSYVHPEDRQMVMDAVEAAVYEKLPYSLDHRILRPGGSVRYVHEQGEVTYDSDGAPLRMVGTVHDVTDRKLAEDALVEKAEELARSNADLEQFAYVASHDLQEPLRMVTSFTQLLQRRYKDKLDEKANQYIGFAVEGTQRMQALIKDLMTYSRAGRPDRDFEPAECEDILQHSTANLKLAIQESGAVITHDPLPVVRGDHTQLGQIFQNLIGNALKFRGEEAPRVHISAQRDGKQWIFSVRDNGLGIDPKFRERIFVIFQRLHHREDYAGTGIGLALCKKIVERHGGRIWVESEPGQGSTFYFTIPTEGVRHNERTQQPVG